MAGKKDLIKDEDRYSIIVNDMSKCFICGQSPTHIHEVFGGSNRAKSKSEGMCIGLCGPHHNLSSAGIHFNKALDNKVKQQAEKIWIEKNTDASMDYNERIAAFIKVFGRNYLDE